MPVPLRLILGRTDRVVVALEAVTAYTTGIEMTLSVRARQQSGSAFVDDPLEFPFGHPMRPHQPGEIPPDVLRFGVQFSDGRKATTVGSALPWVHPGDLDEEPAGPVLTPSGGGGGGAVWDSELWLWPLPPPGPLAFVVEWPKANIELTKHEVDADLLIEASKDSEVLWPDEGRSRGSASTFQIVLGGEGDEVQD